MNKLAYSLIVLSFSLNACRNNDIHVQVKESPETLLVKADYPKEKTERVQDYIADAFASSNVFEAGDNRTDRETALADGTNFHITSSPGELEITLIRRKNSVASYQRLKKIGEGLGTMLHR